MLPPVGVSLVSLVAPAPGPPVPVGALRVDAARVADKTAQAAMSVLNLRIFHAMDDATRDAFQEQAIRMGDAEDTLYPRSCEIATRLGPPDYYPKYMIAHGMAAFAADAGDGMKADVDEEALWVDVMERINGCAAYVR